MSENYTKTVIFFLSHTHFTFIIAMTDTAVQLQVCLISMLKGGGVPEFELIECESPLKKKQFSHS